MKKIRIMDDIFSKCRLNEPTTLLIQKYYVSYMFW